MDTIAASSLAELSEAVAAAPDNVPRRGFGRLTEHTEPWMIKRLIVSLATSGIVNFPLRVELADRPDVVVESNGRDIGIELIELVPPAYAQAMAIANREFPTAIVDREVFGWGTAWTAAAIRECLRREGHRLSGNGWAGDAVEREWAAAVCGAIDKKTERLNRSGFRHFSENWLGTYASSPGPIFDVGVGVGLLAPSDLRRQQFKRNFDVAANLVSDSVVVVSAEGVTRCKHIRP